MPSRISFDVVELLRDMSSRWKKLAVPTKVMDPDYFVFKDALDATKELNTTITTLLNSDAKEEQPTDGWVASFVLRIAYFIASHFKVAGNITFLGVRGDDDDVELLKETLSILGFQSKMAAEDQGGYMWWLWEFKRPKVPLKVELTLYGSVKKATPSRLEQNLAVKKTQSKTPHYRRMAVLTCPVDSREKLYESIQLAMKNNQIRSECKGYKPEKPFTGMTKTPGNVAFVSYFDGDVSKLR